MFFKNVGRAQNATIVGGMYEFPIPLGGVCKGRGLGSWGRRSVRAGCGLLALRGLGQCAGVDMTPIQK